MNTMASHHPAPPILVVDDDPRVREVVVGQLIRNGYEAAEAEDGDDALEIMHRMPSLKLVISDVRMPRVSGLQLAEEAAKRFPKLRVVLISGYFQEQAMGWKFLRKPFSLKQLLEVVQSELAHSSSSDSRG